MNIIFISRLLIFKLEWHFSPSVCCVIFIVTMTTVLSINTLWFEVKTARVFSFVFVFLPKPILFRCFNERCRMKRVKHSKLFFFFPVVAEPKPQSRSTGFNVEANDFCSTTTHEHICIWRVCHVFQLLRWGFFFFFFFQDSEIKEEQPSVSRRLSVGGTARSLPLFPSPSLPYGSFPAPAATTKRV